jgi:hypothetical protein
VSAVAIANLALDAVGARATISSFTEASKEARVISRQYDQALDDVLGAAHWNFARKQLALTLLKDGSAGDTVPAPWLYEYAYPSDCVGARYILPTVSSDPSAVVGRRGAAFQRDAAGALHRLLRRGRQRRADQGDPHQPAAGGARLHDGA